MPTVFKMAKSKKTEKDFAFPLLAAMKHSMSGDEKGKDQSRSPERENITNRNSTKIKII